ncbi:Single-stranded DNA-binding protein ssbB [Gemella morbillorum]|jgi:single-stranded DNA-binding protein ssbB|uniref:Single-stranded DNA-binding protein n=1 Tax=Gemella morbillorum TaxID=29391 RepID=A0A2X4N957_9BACL|nr:single-stranded DNA-binding protein [Gemella morbillorum]EFV35501.1 single-strand binding protein family [Gemella morbillorum M424]MBF1210208.1 single-stranded DNA-binding protein [Gemella morbillorum]MDK8239769.1 single-stranded DNA-binding protein [Gemella morbillorum]MDK8255023.1 single-stranded DNA-binding protein [Gemella morbillorum]QGS08765.1 single-stranded DNA-binding protein [Gemella morbillorum]
MLNQVILIGRLVKKPELRVSEGGVNYIKATLAVQSEFKNKDGDYDTEFLEFTAFGKLAENTAKYCDKGSLLNIVGSLNNNVYKDKNGVNHYQLSIIANKVSFLSRSVKKEEKQDGDVFVLGQ